MFTCGGYDMRPLEVSGCILYQYTCHSTTLFNISVLATGSIVYQCIGHTQSARNLSCGSWGSNKGGQIASPSFAKKQLFANSAKKNFP